MKLAVATVLAALATGLLLNTFEPTPVLRAAAKSQPSVFLAGASVMIAADGSCPVATDARMPLLGTVGSEAEALPSRKPDVAAADPPPGGSCGGHLAGRNADAAQVSAEADALPAHEPEVAVSKPLPAAAATPVMDSPRPSDKPRARRAPPPAKALTAWWPERKPDALNVLFVGEAAFGSAISVLTDGSFDNADSANAYIEVKDAAGRRLSRRWQLATNPKMLLLPVKAGIYAVSIRSELADAQGRQAGTASSGAVYVR